MDDSRVEAVLDEAIDLFDTRPSDVEAGLDVASAELIQLRKACRLLDAARHLDRVNGYFTVVIEISFAAIERTVQFHLLANGFIHPEEYVDHRIVYERGREAGLYSEAFEEKLVRLWRNNRSRSYYRDGVATRPRAEKLRELSSAIHSHVLQLAGEHHECICATG